MALIDTENEEIKVLFNNILWLSNQPVVIKKGNYFNKKTGDLGNICSEIQNFIYENFYNNFYNKKHNADPTFGTIDKPLPILFFESSDPINKTFWYDNVKQEKNESVLTCR